MEFVSQEVEKGKTRFAWLSYMYVTSISRYVF